jgi:hypothetical protein
MKGLLQTLQARLDRQEGTLAAINAKLQYLDSTLDGRLASALSSELLSPISADMADMEKRLADRLDPAKREEDGSEHSKEGCTPTQASSEIPARLPVPRAAPSRPDSAAGPSQQRVAPVPAARDLVRLADTRTLKHSFLRRFVSLGEEGRRDQDPPPRQLHRLRDRLLESGFGICEADPRVGKEGSRAIHPQSHFVTGGPAALPTAGPPSTRAPPPRRAEMLLEKEHAFCVHEG